MPWSSSNSSAWLRPRNAFLGLNIILAILPFFVPTCSALTTPVQFPASPEYQGSSAACPARCATSGPNPANWSLYHNFEQFSACQESLFYSFSFSDPVDDPDTVHRIYACTSFGPDWGNLPANTSSLRSQSIGAPGPVNGTYQIGAWPSAPGSSASSSLVTLTNQFRQYLLNGFGSVNHPTVLFASYGSTTVGLYIGQGLQNQGIAKDALVRLDNALTPSSPNISLPARVGIQFCQPGQSSDHIFGLIATGNGAFAPIQEALASWSKAECLSFPLSQNVTGTVPLVTPLSTSSTHVTSINSTETYDNDPSVQGRALVPQTTCSTVKVAHGDGCSSLAQKCGISPAQFTRYNPKSNECSTLQPGEHVCCSTGQLPDVAPKPQPDGTCATYTVQPNDDCNAIAATYGLTVDNIKEFNKNTWAWNGCKPLYAHNVICLSKGNPPMPAPVSNAVCGPQVRGTLTPPSGTNISMLNQCPLNACCDVWGQCGTTAEFCINTGTSAPGTAAPGTNGCISNCGTSIVRSSPPATYRNIGYYEGYNLERSCLYQDISQLDISKNTHIYFAFGVLSSSYEVYIPNLLATYEFKVFRGIQGAKRILSIGGWAFSTDPSTYMIFREGVTSANRETMATKIAKFINDNDLDGVNMDWEYPGAPDIPGIPPGSHDDGANYLEFLKKLRSLLPNKEVTIAAPASYWYLKSFPIKEMASVLDYIVYMTYDLHGQWDSGSRWSQSGCPTGTCLRSPVNLTETIGTLVMITKAGVPSNQVVVGVTSYGRSFAMAEAGCYGPQCKFLGSAADSKAKPGPCTQTAGYISNAEIKHILANPNRVNQHFIHDRANTNVLVYDDTQWVGWMSDSVKASRTSHYKSLAMGGTTDWATDLQEYHPPPFMFKSWPSFKNSIVLAKDPFNSVGLAKDPAETGKRTGNWTSLTCTNPAVQYEMEMGCSQQWSELDASNAWSDATNNWFNIDKKRPKKYRPTFSTSILNFFHRPAVDCGDLDTCSKPLACTDFYGTGRTTGGSGPAGMLIYNSLSFINNLYSEFHSAIVNECAMYIDNQLPAFEDTFAPVPPTPNEEWLQIFMSFISLGLTAVMAPYLQGVYGGLPALASLGDAGKGVAIDMTYATISFGASAAHFALPPAAPGKWTSQSQNGFSGYLGTVPKSWGDITVQQLGNWFNGSEASVNHLGSMIANGRLIECHGHLPKVGISNSLSNIQNLVGRAFFGFAIPSLWAVSGKRPFVVDSGYPCSAAKNNPLIQYMTAATQEATRACYNNKLYYLVQAEGTWHGQSDRSTTCYPVCTNPPKPSFFTPPPGLSSLGGGNWGGITLSDLIEGSVNTHVGNHIADPMDKQTIQDMANNDITTAGYIRLPVCSPQVAWASWSNPSRSNSSAPGYPCNPLQGITTCSGYTYQDQTTSSSPKVSDCLAIIQNIQGSGKSWRTGIDYQRGIAHFGSCHFGVQNSGTTGDVTYFTGSQDVVNIITEAISKFAWDGLVGAKGYMECTGDVNTQKVEWGLY